jgi:aerobic-type carbon monoxide dehydrogenase small subunit (CoxS/CutS family)
MPWFILCRLPALRLLGQIDRQFGIHFRQRFVAKPLPTDEDIDRAVTNICRCGTYTRVRKAIHVAARG